MSIDTPSGRSFRLNVEAIPPPRERRRRERHERHRHGHWHHGPPLPLILLLVFFGVTHMAAVAGAVFMASMTAMLVFGTVLVARHALVPALRQFSTFPAGAFPGTRRSERFPSSYDAPLPFERSRMDPALLGPDAYRLRLLDVLKERYVRGEIALAEFEERVSRVVRDPSVKHLR